MSEEEAHELMTTTCNRPLLLVNKISKEVRSASYRRERPLTLMAIAVNNVLEGLNRRAPVRPAGASYHSSLGDHPRRPLHRTTPAPVPSSFASCSASRTSRQIRDVPYRIDDWTSRERLAILALCNKLGATIGGCEKLVQTPVPLHYVRHTSRFLTIWCFLLPLVIGACAATGGTCRRLWPVDSSRGPVMLSVQTGSPCWIVGRVPRVRGSESLGSSYRSFSGRSRREQGTGDRGGSKPETPEAPSPRSMSS